MRDGGFNRVGNGFMGVAEGQTLFDHVISQIGCGGVAFEGGALHGFGFDGDGAHHVGKNAQRVFERVYCVKQRLFVFLVVFVVGQRLTFHQGNQPHQMTDDTTRFAARQLGHVGIFLLRHDGRARGVCIANLNETKALAHPQDQFL